MNRATCTLVSCLLALVSLPGGIARADVVRRALCTRAEVAREVELRTVDGMADVCDVVERRTEEGSEERTLHPAAASSGFCAARFEGLVRTLSDGGWRCSTEPGASRSRAPPRPAASPPDGAGPFARTWWSECTNVHAASRDDAGTLCGCAVGIMSEAGFEERDFEVLASPYATSGAKQPVHRAGLLYGVGMMAVDALARCGAP